MFQWDCVHDVGYGDAKRKKAWQNIQNIPMVPLEEWENQEKTWRWMKMDLVILLNHICSQMHYIESLFFQPHCSRVSVLFFKIDMPWLGCSFQKKGANCKNGVCHVNLVEDDGIQETKNICIERKKMGIAIVSSLFWDIFWIIALLYKLYIHKSTGQNAEANVQHTLNGN